MILLMDFFWHRGIFRCVRSLRLINQFCSTALAALLRLFELFCLDHRLTEPWTEFSICFSYPLRVSFCFLLISVVIMASMILPLSTLKRDSSRMHQYVVVATEKIKESRMLLGYTVSWDTPPNRLPTFHPLGDSCTNR